MVFLLSGQRLPHLLMVAESSEAAVQKLLDSVTEDFRKELATDPSFGAEEATMGSLETLLADRFCGEAKLDPDVSF